MQLHFTNREYEPEIYSIGQDYIYMYPRDRRTTPIIKFTASGCVYIRPSIWFTNIPHSDFKYGYTPYNREVFS